MFIQIAAISVFHCEKYNQLQYISLCACYVLPEALTLSDVLEADSLSHPPLTTCKEMNVTSLNLALFHCGGVTLFQMSIFYFFPPFRKCCPTLALRPLDAK